MLRTAAITQFFNANLTSPHLETLLLTTPSGKLLSLSSPLPASALRTQATLASQLWTSYQPVARSSLLAASLPVTRSSPEQSRPQGRDLKCITLQLEHGIMVIRQLKCSLLFIAIGPGPQRPPTASSITCMSTNASRDVTPTPYHDSSLPAMASDLRIHSYENFRDGGSSIRTSETLSSSLGVATSMAIVQKQSEELGKWLDTELANFELTPS